LSRKDHILPRGHMTSAKVQHVDNGDYYCVE